MQASIIYMSSSGHAGTRFLKIFFKSVVCYLVALMLTVLLCAEFALLFDAQTAFTL